MMFRCLSIQLCLWFWILLVTEAAPGLIFPYVPENGYCTDSRTEYLSGGVCCQRCPPESGLVMSSPCTKTRKSVCVCPKNSICIGEPPSRCESCEDHNPCQPGTYTSQRGDLVQHPQCSPCPAGTFNDLPSITARCSRHRNCTELGKVQAKSGTLKSDAVCKDPKVVMDTGYLGSLILLAVLAMLVIGAIAGAHYCLRRKQQHNDKDHTPGSGRDTEQSSLLSPSGSIISSTSSIPKSPAPSAGSTPPLIDVPHLLTAVQGAEHETHSRASNGLQCGREAGQQERLCQVPFIGEMKVSGNVYIYNGPVVNQASPSSEQPRDTSPLPSSSPPVSHFRLPVQEDRSAVPVQEQQGAPLQESGKESHITIEETNSY
ncbi:tumor necrosis factor receptor superfamily member 3-like isoform X2 [Polyodon spathula]|uniref:tumor necrosis factor receptor superfamily member 3-like isoform X2 n=1 Tax=Polyodon spathula TaxID=7913 RepID=UPI001B7DF118|nr:tumor necrosis factor receptor superfamily member 3-like isoform X2 [Polyodon spathula]